MSNIAIVYGYGFQNLSADQFNILEEDIESNMDVLMGYSVSAYEPDTAVIGIRVMSDIGLFCPTEIQNTLTEKQKQFVDSFKIPQSLQKYLINKKPKFLMYGYSDD